MAVNNFFDFVHPAREGDLDVFEFYVGSVIEPRDQRVALLVLKIEPLEDAEIFADLLNMNFFVFQAEFPVELVEKCSNVDLIS